MSDLYNSSIDSRHDPFVKRVFRRKNPGMKFFCPLCRSERSLSHSVRWKAKNTLQVCLTSCLMTLLLWPVCSWRGICSFFFVWPVMEWLKREALRAQIPCEHCGFDAILYKKDVKRSKQKVIDFFANKSAE